MSVCTCVYVCVHVSVSVYVYKCVSRAASVCTYYYACARIMCEYVELSVLKGRQ